LAKAKCGSYRGIDCVKDESGLCTDDDTPCRCVGLGDNNELVAVCKSEDVSKTVAVVLFVLCGLGAIFVLSVVGCCIRRCCCK